VIIFHVRNELDGLTVAAGAITGRLHADRVVSLLEAQDNDELGSQVVFNFDGIDMATASYLKASVLWAVTCGRIEAGIIDPEELRQLDASHFRPLSIYPLVAGANTEVETELQEIFGGRWLACVVTDEWTPKNVRSGKVLGKLDPTAAKTLKAIKGLHEFTAYDLQERFPKEGVNATAWNNRLVELFRLRLLRRRKQGKFWKYQPVADHLTYG